MRIIVLNGSPHVRGNTSFMVDAFVRGARQSDHGIRVLPVGTMQVHGCIGCNHCKAAGGMCVFEDGQQEVVEALSKADMLVLASPIYYFMISAQLEATIQRMHAMGFPPNVKQTALLLSSRSNGVQDAAVRQYHMIFQEYLGMQDVGVIMAPGRENRSRALEERLMEFDVQLI